MKNKTESAILFEDMSLMNSASNLAMYELMGDVEFMNTELNKYKDVSPGRHPGFQYVSVGREKQQQPVLLQQQLTFE